MQETSVLSTLWLQRCIQAIRIEKPDLLIDVGCGRKPYKNTFHAQNHIGVDWLNTFHINEEIDAFADVSRLPFVDSIFDAALCTEVLEHVPEPEITIAEINRVLKLHGDLILSVPFSFHIHESPWDYHRFTVYALQHLLHKNGFEIISTTTRGGTFTVWFDIMNRAWGSFLKHVMKKLRLPRPVYYSIMTVFVVFPQKLAAWWGFFLIDKLPKLTNHLDPSHSHTLGYVVVARKKAHVRHHR
jgi:SAM-dependent methyltransferase